jgi:peroxidase
MDMYAKNANNPSSYDSSYDNSNNAYQNPQQQYIEQYQAPQEFCPYAEKPYCDFNYPYRTMDGSCNNKENTWWGRSETPFKRILTPAYHDGLNEPRYQSMTGKRLENPRRIAMHLHHADKKYSKHITNLLPHFSQFVDHDISLTAMTADEDGVAVRCFCNNDDPDCISIAMPAEDKVNSDQRCMVTPRSSASYRRFNCNLGAREQFNLASHWLDLSQTYGHNLGKTLHLRLFSGGFLNHTAIKGMRRNYLPFDKHRKCDSLKKGEPCFDSGDDRINQNVGLTTMHTIWFREHNRVAKQLHRINPNWDDEKLFQEARRITIAKYQHIIYKEWLPLVVSHNVAHLYGLRPLNQGYFYGYDINLYAHVLNEFSTAAFRFGHSLVRDYMSRVDAKYKPFQNVSMHSLIFRPSQAFKRGGLDSIARGCVYDMAGKYDMHVIDSLNNHLFENMDPSLPTRRYSLTALNINRGRDHGLQSYVEYRAMCGHNYAENFDDLYNVPKSGRASLKKIYEHVRDIDLFTGGLSEDPLEGGVVGPTFACKYSNSTIF